MRRVVKKIFNDGQTKRGIGFGLPINGSIVFNPTYTTKDQIRYNLINYLMTNKNERVFNNKFGANLRSIIFEGIDIDNLNPLQQKLKQDINEYFPQIDVINLYFKPNEEKNEVRLIFEYRMSGYNIDDVITITIN